MAGGVTYLGARQVGARAVNTRVVIGQQECLESGAAWALQLAHEVLPFARQLLIGVQSGQKVAASARVRYVVELYIVGGERCVVIAARQGGQSVRL